MTCSQLHTRFGVATWVRADLRHLIHSGLRLPMRQHPTSVGPRRPTSVVWGRFAYLGHRFDMDTSAVPRSRTPLRRANLSQQPGPRRRLERLDTSVRKYREASRTDEPFNHPDISPLSALPLRAPFRTAHPASPSAHSPLNLHTPPWHAGVKVIPQVGRAALPSGQQSPPRSARGVCRRSRDVLRGRARGSATPTR